MTKKNMIQEIQNQEAQLYFSYMQAAKLWGREDALTIRLQTKWCSVYQLMEALGIPQDNKHPDNRAAMEIRFALPEAS
jgi:hypothetical protein